MTFLPFRWSALTYIILSVILISYTRQSNGSVVYEIKDLNQTDSSFTTQAGLWTASNLKSTTIYTQCNSVYVLGGYNILGNAVTTSKGDYYQRVYTGLTTHNMIYFTLNLWAIDDWTTTIFNSDRFQLQFDNTLIDGYNYQNSNFPGQLCGSTTWNDLGYVRLFGRLTHSAANLTLRVIHMINKDSSLASVAVRDIDLLLVNNTQASTTTQMCAIASISSGTSACGCSEGNYESPVGSGMCYACDSNCSSCFGPSAKECYQCKPGYTFNGVQCILCHSSCSLCTGTANSQCSVCAAGYFLMNNNTCVSSCNSPLIQTSDGQQTYCASPCNSSQFLLWDGSCSFSCDSPLQQNTSSSTGIKYCNYPCTTSQFLLWNGTCSNSCPSPLVSQITNCRNFCTYPCNSNQFLYWNGSCTNTCSSPLIQITQGGKQFCNSPCTLDEFLYWNGSCSSSCPSPFTQRFSGDINYCDLGCTADQFLYWNGTCSSSCPSPLTQKIEGVSNTKLCTFSCSPGEFLYWNGSCLSSCITPYTAHIRSGKAFCESPCQNSGDFVYMNGTCLSSCSSPFEQILDGTTKLCGYKCESDQYLYPNGSCSAKCDAPWKQQSRDGNLYCNNPCSAGKYLFWDESCIESCEAPLLMESQPYGNLCHLPCDSVFEYYYEDTQTCSDECNGRTVNYKGLFFKCIPSDSTETEEDQSNDDDDDDGVEAQEQETNEQGLLVIAFQSLTKPGDMTFIPINRLLQYISYLDIKLPARLERLIRSQGRGLSSISFVSRMASRLRSGYKSYQLPFIFEKRGLHSRFLVNFLESSLVLLALSLIVIFMAILHRASVKYNWKRGQPTIERLKHIFCWNLWIVYLAVNIGDIILYASLELRTAHGDQFRAFLSLITCILALLVSLTFFILACMIGKRLDSSKVTPLPSSSQKPSAKGLRFYYDLFQVVFQGFETQSRPSKYFFLLYIVRVSLPMFFTSCLVRFPLAQTIINTVLCLSMLLFVLLKKPIKNRLNNNQLAILEGLTLLVNLCMFALALMDSKSLNNTLFWTFVGDVSIDGVVASNLLIVGVLIYKAVKEIRAIHRSQHNKSTTSRLGMLDFFLPFIQQAAFGFEEVVQPLHRAETNKSTDDTRAKTIKGFFNVTNNPKDEEANRRLNDISPDPSFFNNHLDNKSPVAKAGSPTLLSEPVFSESDILTKLPQRPTHDPFNSSQSRIKPAPQPNMSTQTIDKDLEDNKPKHATIEAVNTESEIASPAKIEPAKVSLADVDKKSNGSSEHIDQPNDKNASFDSVSSHSFVASPFVPTDKRRRQRHSIFKPSNGHSGDYDGGPLKLSFYEAVLKNEESNKEVIGIYESIKRKSLLNSMISGTTPKNEQKMQELKKSLAVPTIISINKRRKSTFA